MTCKWEQLYESDNIFSYNIFYSVFHNLFGMQSTPQPSFNPILKVSALSSLSIL